MTRIHSIFKQSALATALAVVTLATPAAFAQSQYRGHDRGHHDDRREHRDHRNDRDHRSYNDNRAPQPHVVIAPMPVRTHR